MQGWLGRLQNQGLATQSALLGLAVLCVYLVVAPVAASLSGGAGLAAAAAAAGLCLLGAGSALVVTRPFRGPNYALFNLLIGMPLRMGLPLAVGLVLQWRGGLLAGAGVLYYLLVFYPIALGVETVLSLPTAERPPDGTHVS